MNYRKRKVSKGARKQVNQFLKNANKLPTNNAAIYIKQTVEKMSSVLGIITTISTTVLGLFY